MWHVLQCQRLCQTCLKLACTSDCLCLVYLCACWSVLHVSCVLHVCLRACLCVLFVCFRACLCVCVSCSPEWGDAATCPPSAPELVLRQDGCLDVRLPAVLAALLDTAAAAATAAGSSSSSGSSEAAAAGDGCAGVVLDAVVAGVVRARCRQLLQEMPTSLQQDREWLQQQQQAGSAAADGDDSSSGLLSAVVQYRLAKKQLLAQFAEM